MSADGKIVCIRNVNCLKQLTQGTAFQLCWLMSHDGISQTSDTHKIDRKRGEEVAILQGITRVHLQRHVGLVSCLLL